MDQIVKTFQTELTGTFEHLHANPEVSWKEVQTTAYIQRLLEEKGVKVTTFHDCTGLIAEIGKGKPVVAVRADMDALWQQVEAKIDAVKKSYHTEQTSTFKSNDVRHWRRLETWFAPSTHDI